MNDKLQLRAEAEDVLFREAYYLDGQKWDDWLELFTEDCEYWVPSWKDEHQVTEDPKREISLIYYGGRFGLEDRVWRIRSGQSIASTPLPRTTHAVHNVFIDGQVNGEMTVRSTWTANCFFHKTNKSEVFYGDYEHRLRKTDDGWKICRKYVVLKNDYIPTMLDVYNI